MRSSRLRKYRKKYKKIIMLTQVLLIWYVAIISLSLLTSGTVAYFNTSSKVNATISAGKWWDDSDLTFVTGNQNIKACAPIEIEVELKNSGEDMAGTTKFEVYYVEQGNPENKHGEKVGEGTVEEIKGGKTAKLTFDAKDNGFYKFKVFQRPEYQGNGSLEIWSHMIHVNCNAASSNVEIDNNDKHQENHESNEQSNHSHESNDSGRKEDVNDHEENKAEKEENEDANQEKSDYGESNVINTESSEGGELNGSEEIQESGTEMSEQSEEVDGGFVQDGDE